MTMFIAACAKWPPTLRPLEPTDLSWESTDSMLTVYTHRHHLLLLFNPEAE